MRPIVLVTTKRGTEDSVLSQLVGDSAHHLIKRAVRLDEPHQIMLELNPTDLVTYYDFMNWVQSILDILEIYTVPALPMPSIILLVSVRDSQLSALLEWLDEQLNVWRHRVVTRQQDLFHAAAGAIDLRETRILIELMITRDAFPLWNAELIRLHEPTEGMILYMRGIADSESET